MKNKSETIRKIINCLNNAEEEGGYWLPNIQRPFVWNEEQMARLLDSLMRDYPISTLLVWRTKEEVAHRKFIDNYHRELRLSDFKVPQNGNAKNLVLDGQQRLQSLFIALQGSYDRRELHFDILSGDLAHPEDIRYRFRFLDSATAQWPWVRFKDIIYDDSKKRLVIDKIASMAPQVSDDEKDRIEENYDQIVRVFREQDRIAFQLLDDVEYSGMYSLNDVVEVFIRANAGGTRLGKSDLLFSLLSSSWEEADERMEELLDQLNRDFVLKTCLTVLNTGARYDVTKLRDPKNRDLIIEKWKSISAATLAVKDFLVGSTYIRCDKAMPSYLVLIPVVYFRYHYPEKWKTVQDLDSFLLRCLLTSAFSGSPDQLIDACIEKIKAQQDFSVPDLFNVIRDHNRSLDISEEALLGEGYGSKMIHLLLNLWYREFNYLPAYANNQPQVDHIFPQSLLKRVKRANEAGEMRLMKYYAEDRNQIANCMLLSREENGAGGKSDTPPDEWFADKDDAYLDMHLIPRNKELWHLDRFEEFIAERKKLILAKFAYLLLRTGDTTATTIQATEA